MAATYHWDFGDGGESTEKDPIHIYKLPGVYTVTYTVTLNGVSDTDTETITVTEEDGNKYDLSIAERSTRRCFHYGTHPAVHGAGWSEVSDRDSDGDYPWPEDPGSVVSMFDGDNLHIQVVWDSQDGLPWIIDARKAPSNSKITEAWIDKKDINDSTAGTEILSTIEFGEDVSEEQNYEMEHLETNLFLAPMDTDNAGASGYDSLGYRDAFAVDISAKADNSETEIAKMEDVPVDREIFFDRKVRGNEIKITFETESSEYRLTRRETYYKSYDRARHISKNDMSETDWQETLLDPAFWLSRGDTLLLNRITGATVSGTVTASDGADGKQDSAMTLSTSIALGNAAQASGTMMFVSTTELDPGSLGFGTFGESFSASSQTWYLRYFSGSIPSNVSLPAGTIFDVRIYSSTLDDSATESELKYYYDTLVNHQGDSLLPLWGIDV